MQCPTCGEKRIKWAHKPWDSANKDFWADGVIITFLCFGKFKKENGQLIEISPCKAGK